MFARFILLTGCIALSSCAVTYENVAGSWSCSRVDGVCEDIDSIDEGLVQSEDFDVNPVPLADLIESSDPSVEDSILAIPSHDEHGDTTSVPYDDSDIYTEESVSLPRQYVETDNSNVLAEDDIDGSNWNKHSVIENVPSLHSEIYETRLRSNDIDLNSENSESDLLDQKVYGTSEANLNSVPPFLGTEDNDTSENEETNHGHVTESKSINDPASNINGTKTRTPAEFEEKFVDHSKTISDSKKPNQPTSENTRTISDHVDKAKQAEFEENLLDHSKTKSDDKKPNQPTSENTRTITDDVDKAKQAEFEENLLDHSKTKSDGKRRNHYPSKKARTIIDDGDKTKQNVVINEQHFDFPKRDLRESVQNSTRNHFSSSTEFKEVRSFPSSRPARSLQRLNSVSRSPEKLAKIVFAPVIDSNGNYHAERTIYIVVESSQWIVKRSDND